MVALPTSRWARNEPAEQAGREDWMVLLVDPMSGRDDKRAELGGATPPARPLAVVAADAPGANATCADHVFYQPAARGSGFGAYIALAMIRRWNPSAVVAIVPSHAHL